MARLMRPLRLWPTLHIHTFSSSSSPLLISSLSTNLSSAATWHNHRYSTLPASSISHPRALKLPNSDIDETGSGSDSDEKQSRNQKKRLARQAVRWGMDLASFSTPQIKRILKAAQLEREVFEAIMLVKRLGPDVREGKRRQFSYIGKLLRDVEPELLATLIQATKDGDHSTLQALAGAENSIIEDEDDDSEEDEGSSEYIDVAMRWVDGLINKDIEITKEVYAVNALDFDRQELRKLVREVHAVNEEDERAMKRAKRSLTRFLRDLAKQISIE